MRITMNIIPRNIGEEGPEGSNILLVSALDSVVNDTLRPLYASRETPGIHCTGGWVSPRNGKSLPDRDSIPEPFSPQRVTTPTELPAHVCFGSINVKSYIKYNNNIISPFTGLQWPRGFQELKVPRFHDNGTGRW